MLQYVPFCLQVWTLRENIERLFAFCSSFSILYLNDNSLRSASKRLSTFQQCPCLSLFCSLPCRFYILDSTLDTRVSVSHFATPSPNASVLVAHTTMKFSGFSPVVLSSRRKIVFLRLCVDFLSVIADLFACCSFFLQHSRTQKRRKSFSPFSTLVNENFPVHRQMRAAI